MEDGMRALDVPQEFVAEAFSFRSAFDETGNVRENQAVIGTEVRLQCGERIRADFRVRAGKHIQKRGLAGARKPHKPHISDHLQFEMEIETLAWLSFLSFFRRRVRARAKMKIATPAKAAVGDEKLFAFFRELFRLAGVSICDDGANRHFQYQVLPALAIA